MVIVLFYKGNDMFLYREYVKKIGDIDGIKVVEVMISEDEKDKTFSILQIRCNISRKLSYDDFRSIYGIFPSIKEIAKIEESEYEWAISDINEKCILNKELERGDISYIHIKIEKKWVDSECDINEVVRNNCKDRMGYMDFLEEISERLD